MNRSLPKHLVVFYSIWSLPRLWIVTKGTTQPVKTLADCRQIAKDKGYAGIKVH